jgi:hypothetical protein
MKDRDGKDIYFALIYTKEYTKHRSHYKNEMELKAEVDKKMGEHCIITDKSGIEDAYVKSPQREKEIKAALEKVDMEKAEKEEAKKAFFDTMNSWLAKDADGVLSHFYLDEGFINLRTGETMKGNSVYETFKRNIGSKLSRSIFGYEKIESLVNYKTLSVQGKNRLEYVRKIEKENLKEGEYLIEMWANIGGKPQYLEAIMKKVSSCKDSDSECKDSKWKVRGWY